MYRSCWPCNLRAAAIGRAMDEHQRSQRDDILDEMIEETFPASDAHARHEGLRIVPVCPFVKAFLQKHPESSEIG